MIKVTGQTIRAFPTAISGLAYGFCSANIEDERPHLQSTRAKSLRRVQIRVIVCKIADIPNLPR